MDRRKFLKTAGLVSAGLATQGFSSSKWFKKSKPNVVIVMTDDQGMGDMSCMGNPYVQTPVLDELWADSYRLTDYHVCPTCSPTRAGFLTGQYSNRVGALWTVRSQELVYRDKIMMADVFKANGYSTGMFGKWHLGENYPFRPQDRGYDQVTIHGGGAISQSPDYWGNDLFDDTYYVNGKPTNFEGYCTDIWFDEASKFIKKSGDKPFFAHIATNIAHVPMIAPEGYEEKYLDMGLDSWMARFYSMIQNMDENLGRLIQLLKDEGKLDDTLFMFTTDNGSSAFKRVMDGQTPLNDPLKQFELLNGGLRGHKGLTYDGGHRVPMFIKWPKMNLNGGKDINALCGHIDILPTLMDLCDLKSKAAENFDGRSLAPIISGKMKDWKDDRVLVNDSQRVEEPVKYRRGMVMTSTWRLLYSNKKDTPPELYKTTDRAQQNNVSKQYPEVVKKLVAAYDVWWDELLPDMQRVARIVVGNDADNPARISSHEMRGGKGDFRHSAVDKLENKNDGYYTLEADVSGTYTFDLMRWPPEAMGPINGQPKWPLTRGKTKQISVNRAELKLDGKPQFREIKYGDEFASFTVKLDKGPFKLENMFYENEKPVVGASYIRVTRA